MNVPSVVWWHSEDGQKPALMVKQTKRNTTLVVLEDGRGVVLRRVPNETTELKPVRIVKIRLRPLLRSGADYPVRRAVAQFRREGRDLGISKAAEEALAATYTTL